VNIRPLYSFILVLALAGCGGGGDNAQNTTQSESRPAAAKISPAQSAPQRKSDSTDNALRPSKVELSGYGAIRIGMALSELKKLPDGWTLDDSPTEGCNIASSAAHPNLHLMIVDNRVVRMEVSSPHYETARGARVGMNEPQIKSLYPSHLTVEAHPYTGPQGHYLVYHEEGGKMGMIMETDGEKILSYRVGEWEAVQWIEGCL
jgi:hypothetical protein